jgi:hypothetical protein
LKEGPFLKPPKKEKKNKKKKKKNQWTSQVAGSTTPSPNAPALAQSTASSLILLTRVFTDGLILLKMQLFMCFHMSGVSNAEEAKAFVHLCWESSVWR